jgi:hypothetical protein
MQLPLQLGIATRAASPSEWHIFPFRVVKAGLPGFRPTRQAQRLAGGKALGELEANPQWNYYRWCWQAPQPPKPSFRRLNTQSGATHASKRPARPTAPIVVVGQRRKRGGARTAVDMCFAAAPGMLLGLLEIVVG